MIIWLALVLLACAFAFVWSNHFGSGFHLEDSHIIVKNRGIRSLSNIPHFFSSPRSFSARSDKGEYQPLLSTSFALDYALGDHLKPLLYQIENFVWFLLQLVLLFALFSVVPGGTWRSSLAAVMLYGLHPLAAETVNYTAQRGMIFSAIGVVAGLFLWIFWPRMLPTDFVLYAPRVPTNEWDLLRIKLRPRLSKWYRRIINFPAPLYLVPVLIAALAGPSAVVFVPLLVAYILIFEPETRLTRVIPAAVLVGGIGVFEAGVAFAIDRYSRIPALHYLITQPWAAVHYLYSFLVPVRLGPASDLAPFGAPWSPLALAGYAGVAALVGLAMATARKAEWRGVSFGLWWFLLALLPFALVPQTETEAFPRAYIAYAGLVLAVTRAAFILLHRVERARPSSGHLPAVAGAILATLLLAGCGWETYQRNDIWQSDETLWKDAVDKNPRDGRALMNYALTFMNPADDDVFGARYAIGFDDLMRASALLPGDADIETQLGIACEYLGRDADAERHFKRAIALGPSTAAAYAGYSEWLLNHLRIEEAFNAATRAIKLNPLDTVGRRTLAEIYVQRVEWTNAVRMAREVLALDPDDGDAERSLNVAQAGLAAGESARTLAASAPTVDHYLALSVLDYQERKYQECVQAAQEALKLHPELVEAYINIAAAWHAMGKEPETIAALREALRIKPDFDLAKHNLEVELAAYPAAASGR